MERKYNFEERNFISCNNPCGKELAIEVGGDRIRELNNQSNTMRCVASGAALRGQRYPLPGIESHTVKLNACRICTIYTTTQSTA